jgi:hypothetical protein
MATIELQPHNETVGTWLLVWTERHEIIGRVRNDENGCCQITTHGPHWNPMKSFAGSKFRGPDDALNDVRLYFRNR